MRLFIPILLLLVSVGTFAFYINPTYQEVQSLRAEKAEYDAALNNSKILQSIRGSLSDKYKSIDPNNIAKLSKLLPDNVDNIKLILEIQRIASTYGMTLQNVKFDTEQKPTQTANQAGFVTSGAAQSGPKKDFGTFDLEFSTQGSYANFVSFLSDLERSLRIVDVKSISFTSQNAQAGSDTYKYDFKITTYWFRG
ncbi:MAG: type 4a pilus biogenesis protein PilO [Candidatus Pacebacteria bacterium]|jgi:Tfp pilus assembly protein PilO|nr:type 4a pilus biogenesis protein PilO [Candidatus Paceibacterota bacterium]